MQQHRGTLPTCRKIAAAASAAGATAGLAGALLLPPAGAACLAAVLLAAAPRAAAAAQATVSTASVRHAETEAGDAVADAVRVAGGADIGFLPAAAFRPGAAAPRPASAEQMAELLDPSSDQVVVLNLRGSQVLSALERSVSFAPQPSAGFLQVSGIRFTYDSRRDSGKRVTAATLDGKPLEAAKTYRVATTRPLANGQQGYFQIWDKDQIAPASGTPKTLADALAELARARGGSLSPTLDGRITAAEK